MATLPAVHALDEAPGVVASVARIDAWMATAKAGDVFLYATRACLPIGSAGAARMRVLSDRGLVMLTRPRSALDPSVFNYTARRTSTASPLTRPERPRLALPAAAIVDGEVEIVDALLPVLERFARAGRPCPTNRQLGVKANLDENSVKAGLAAMVAGNLIRIQGCAAPTSRRVLILSTGAMTGLAA